MKRLLAALAATALIAGCGGGGSKTASTTTATASVAGTTQTQTTKVEVVKSSGADARTSFDPETIYKTLSPGVVTIISFQNGEKDTSANATEALGSGFIVDPAGYVATNAHVVTSDSGAPAKTVYVQFSDGNRLLGKIVGTDLDSDVALLKIDTTSLRGPDAKVVPLPLGASSELKVGDPVAAIGSPFGERQSLSTGVVSALNRDIESLTRFAIGNAIQTDAAINHGNSGGPLLDSGGKVIGINSQIRSTGGGGEGVGFAIPVETVRRSIEQLRATGHVSYAYVGISSVSLWPQLAARLGLKTFTGALVDSVRKGGPADKAGLHGAGSHISFQGQPDVPVGSDLIVAVDGRKLTGAEDVSDIVAVKKPGDVIKITVLRDGKRITLSAKLTARPGAGAR